MPRFFFDTYDGDFFAPDQEGQDLEGIEAAKLIAQEALPDMASDRLPDGDERVFIVSVRDEAGEVILYATLSLVVQYGLSSQD